MYIQVIIITIDYIKNKNQLAPSGYPVGVKIEIYTDVYIGDISFVFFSKFLGRFLILFYKIQKNPLFS